MLEANRLILILVTLLLSALLIGSVIGLVYMLQKPEEAMIDKVFGMTVQFDLKPLDGQKVAGAAVHSLVLKGVVVKNTSNQTVTQLATAAGKTPIQYAKSIYKASKWYTVSVREDSQTQFVVIS